MQAALTQVFNNGLVEDFLNVHLIFGRYLTTLLFCIRRAGRVVERGGLENR